MIPNVIMSSLETGSVAVSVPKPGRKRSSTAGASIPYTTARSRSSSNPFSSSGAGWVHAVLHLTGTTVFYEVQDGDQVLTVVGNFMVFIIGI